VWFSRIDWQFGFQVWSSSILDDVLQVCFRFLSLEL
jgi:hypothetical protein